MASLPSHCETIHTAKSRKSGVYNIMGRVVDVLPPRRTGGTSFVSTFTLKDCDFSGEWWRGLKIRCFNDKKPSLPCPNLGDVVLLRKIRIRDYQGEVIGSAPQTDNISWTIFSLDTNKKSGLSFKYIWSAPSTAERAYAGTLFANETSPSNTPADAEPSERRSVGNTTSTPPTTSKPSKSSYLKKFSLVKDLQIAKFADIVGQVVKTFAEDDYRFIIYLTDYTQHKGLFNYCSDEDDTGGRDGDEFDYISRASKKKWPGPFGQMTIQITLWDPHAGFAREHVKEEDIVRLRNVQIKDGRSSNFMEGALRTDRIYPGKVMIDVLDTNDRDEHLQEVLRRKTEYWKGRKRKQGRSENSGKRQNSDNEATTSKKNKKKRQKEKQKQQQKRRDDPEQPKLVTSLVKRDQLNKNISAMHPAVPCRPIGDIIGNESHKNSAPGGIEYLLPFQNLRYRASVRVVDFFPPKLEDFAVQYNSDYASLSDAENTDDSNDKAVPGRRKWQWRFCLLIEDGGPGVRHQRDQKRDRMKIFVADLDAVFLLKVDAEDLRKNPEAVARLREKLFILWGDLEERKSQIGDTFDPDDAQSTVSSTPFTCCIKEYGVKSHPLSDDSEEENEEEDGNARVHGWERRFRMFGTTIQD